MPVESDLCRRTAEAMKRRRTVRVALTSLGLLAIVAGIFASSVGCVSTVTPPADPEDAVTVFVRKEARHRGLVLPRAEGGYVEYGYGEFDWYALEEDRWHHAFGTMLFPSTGTLGRRMIDRDSLQGLKALYPHSEFLSLRVSRPLAADLVADLERKFEEGEATLTHNERYRMSFVETDDDFWCFYNCNDATTEWLERLGCSVSWVPVRRDLAVEAAPESDE